jgi:hypothetical protein
MRTLIDEMRNPHVGEVERWRALALFLGELVRASRFDLDFPISDERNRDEPEGDEK